MTPGEFKDPSGPWPKFPKLLMPRDFFPWVIVAGCLEERNGVSYLHIPGCKTCKHDCNPRGGFMARILIAWRDGNGCGMRPKPRRFSMDGSN